MRMRITSMPGGLMTVSRPARAARSAWWPILLGAVGMALAAQLRFPIPGTDVPATLQSLAVLIVGLSLSPVRAALAMLLYLGVGAAGLPVFAPASLGVLGPTGGYLIGFVAAAVVTSVLARGRRAHWSRMIAACLVGLAVLFVFGLTWRMAFFGLSWPVAVQTSILPFLPKAVIESGLAVAAVVAGRKGLARLRD